jgi:hypothetical protein
MKKILAILFVVFSLTGNAQEVNLKMVYNSNYSGFKVFEIYLVSPDQTYSTQNFGNLVFTLRWPASTYDLGSAIAGANGGWDNKGFVATKQGSETTDGSYEYQKFSFASVNSFDDSYTYGLGNGPFDISLQSGTERLIQVIEAPSGYSGTGTEFEIVNDSWTADGANNGNFYVEIDGQDVTGIIYENPNDIIWNGTSWNTTPSTSTGDRAALVKAGGSPVLSANANLTNITFESGATLGIKDGSTLTLTGNVQVVNGTATLNGDVTMTGTVSPIVHGDISIKNLNVNTSSGVKIEGGTTTITRVLTPTLGTITTIGKLVLGATATDVYGQLGEGSGTLSGNLTVQTWLENGSSHNGWHTLGLPVNAAINTMTGINFNGFTGVANTHNVWYWNATNDGQGNDEAEGWTMDDGTGINNKGYQIYTHNTNFPITNPVSISGSVDVSNKTFTGIAYTKDPNNAADVDKQGWNLIANPYPTNYNLQEMLEDADWAGSIKYKAAHIYSVTSSQYVVMTASGVSIVDDGQANASAIIKPFQGFWVKADAASPSSFTLESEYRDTSRSDLLSIYKTSKKEVLRLNLTTGGVWRDQVALYLDDNATSNLFLPAKDALKLMSDYGDNLYMELGGHNTSIKALDESTAIDTIPLSLKTLGTGSFDIEGDASAWNPTLDYFLLDNKLLTITDLGATPKYSFQHDPADGDQRFKLILISKTYGLDDPTNGEGRNPFNLIVKDKTISLDFTNQNLGIASVEVHNLAGQLIYREKRHNTQEPLSFSLKNVRSEVGIYVLAVKLKGGKGYYYQKFIY